MGCIIMFSSYNKFNHNIYRDAAIISVMDTFTSILGASAIFAILGNLKYNMGEGVEFSEIASKGQGLAFITYPNALSKMSESLGEKFFFIPQALAIIFFFMLFVLGIGSSVGLLNNLTTNLKDYFPKVQQSKVAGISCLSGFLIGLMYTTQGGKFMTDIVDVFGGKCFKISKKLLRFNEFSF